ncbi:vitamin D-binding protein [Loxodonta africana]|uniref:vitamin D-binding protein n=1 Tax=Loxodonta africana TaxID=9785 RepID=UPI0030D31D71
MDFEGERNAEEERNNEEEEGELSKIFTVKRLAEAFSKLNQGLHLLENMDPNTDRFAEINRPIWEAFTVGSPSKRELVTLGCHLFRGYLRETGGSAGLSDRKMKGVLVLLLTVAFVHALERGRDYEKDKVCKELSNLGKDDFRSLSMVLYSRKFPSGTFEQVSQLVNEVVSLTEDCCAEGADPNCYDTRTSALSIKSCESDSPFPVHPGTAECCTEEGLERKLCMAVLKHQPQEFPTYVEPTNDEICEAFRKDPKQFADQFIYEYSINYGQAPLPLLVSYVKSYLSMVGSCCTSSSPTVCFLKERLQIKHLSLLTVMSNRICSQYVAYGKEKSRLSHLIKLAQKAPTADMGDVLPLAEDVTNILSKCCESTSEDCMAKELPEHTVKICDNLSTKNSKFEDCCQEKTPMDIFVCTYFMPAAQPPELPAVELPTNKEVCDKESTKATDQYIFELSRRTHIPEVFLTTVLEPTLISLGECCDSEDSTTCFNTKGPLLKKELSSFIEKGQDMCADYSENTFTEYKKKLAERLRAKLPDATPTDLADLVDKRSDFASKCCSINSPPLYCNSQIDAQMKNSL